MSSRRWLFPLCLASVLWAFSFGLGASLASLVLEDAGYTKTVIGLNTSTYYLGIALAAVFVPAAMRRWGWWALLAGMIVSGMTVLAFPWGGSLAGWFVLRALNGVAGACSLIPLETYLNRTSTPNQRSQNFGYYALCIGLGIALGLCVGTKLHAAAPGLAFCLGGAAALSAAAVVLWWRPTFAATEEQHRRTPLQFRRNFLGYGSGWAQGFLEGAMMSFLAIYLLNAGLNEDTAGSLQGGLMIGVILFQVPVAWLADRKGRTAVLISCYVVSLAGLACMLVWLGVAWLAVWLFAVGSCSSAFYPLGLALLGERTPPAGLARANSWYLAINCIGSVTGPVVAGQAMDWFGDRALFLAGLAALLAVLAAWLVLSQRRTPAAAGTIEEIPCCAA